MHLTSGPPTSPPNPLSALSRDSLDGLAAEREAGVGVPPCPRGSLTMAIVGYFSLILTFLAALYGAGAAAYGALRHRPALVESGRHAMLADLAAGDASRRCPSSACWSAAHYQVEYVARRHQPGDADLPAGDGAVGRPGRIAGLLVVADGRPSPPPPACAAGSAIASCCRGSSSSRWSPWPSSSAW